MNVCQSCGLSLATGLYGTERDGIQSKEYCKFCYQNGAFTEPNLSMADMVNIATSELVSKRNMLEYQARQRAQTTILKLNRWAK